MQNKELTHEESFQVIQGMISLAKNKINDTGFHFILWGCLVIVASLAQYFMINDGMGQLSNWVWVAMILIGLPAGIIYEYRKERNARAKNKFDKMYGYLWLGFGITLLASIFISLINGISPVAFVLLLVGLVTFVSGAIYPFKPLVFGGFVFWLAAALCTQVDAENQLLVNALATLIGYVIPGFLLRQKSKTAENV